MKKHVLSWRVVVPTIALPVVVAAMVFPGSAYAKGPKPKAERAACTALGGTLSAPTLSGCSPTLQTGDSGTMSSLPATLATVPVRPSGSVTVTWANTATTTVGFHTSIPSGDHCPIDTTSSANPQPKQTEVILAGKVTGNGGTPPTGDGGVKAAVKTKICVDSQGDVTLLSGQRFSF